MEKRPALGKGLSALIPDVPEIRAGESATEIDVDQILPNELQPRHRFEEAPLDELVCRALREEWPESWPMSTV